MFCWLSQILLYIRQVLLYAIMRQSNVWERCFVDYHKYSCILGRYYCMLLCDKVYVWESEQFNIKCHSNCSIWCIQETVPFTHCTVLWVRTRQYCKPKHFNLLHWHLTESELCRFCFSWFFKECNCPEGYDRVILTEHTGWYFMDFPDLAREVGMGVERNFSTWLFPHEAWESTVPLSK